MDAIKSRLVNLTVMSAMVFMWHSTSAVSATDDTAPPIVWYEDDKKAIQLPKPNNPKETVVMYNENVARPTYRFFHPSRFIRRVGSWMGGDIVRPAVNINTLDEVPNSTWFTNRLGMYEMSPDECARGSRTSGPNTEQPWRVIGAKSGGVTPGFRIEDADGTPFLLKLDPAGYVGTTVRASVVSSLIFYSSGYNVSSEFPVTFGPDDLLIDGEVTYRTGGGKEAILTSENLVEVLGPPHTPDGRWIALASKFLAGTILGPFDYKGRRSDDPNDRINHQDRRELRGLYVFSSWLNHFDSKRENTLDVYIGEPGQGYVKHFLIDYASTLGSGGFGPTRKWGWEYAIDTPATTGRLLSLGFHDDRWTHIERPDGLDEIGYMDNRWFDPIEWKPLRPNTSFAHLTNRDGYWAAKIVTSFSNEHLEKIVAEAEYRNPAAATFMVQALGERRDIIGRYWFDRVPPLDYFAVNEDGISYIDLGVTHSIYEQAQSSYRSRWQTQDGSWSPWAESNHTKVVVNETERAGRPITVQCQVSRGQNWSNTTELEVASDGRISSLSR